MGEFKGGGAEYLEYLKPEQRLVMIQITGADPGARAARPPVGSWPDRGGIQGVDRSGRTARGRGGLDLYQRDVALPPGSRPTATTREPEPGE